MAELSPLSRPTWLLTGERTRIEVSPPVAADIRVPRHIKKSHFAGIAIGCKVAEDIAGTFVRRKQRL